MKELLFFAFTLFVLMAANAQNIGFKYDRADRLVEVDYPNQLKITYNYDRDGNRIGISSTLPVQLLSFVATKQKNEVLLTWEVTQEINVDKYDVQFSMDAAAFQTFTSVMAKGSTGKIEYNTIHCCPAIGNNYYRLKMIDKDGKFTYSEIRKVVFDDSNSFKIYPNPISNKANLTVSFEKPLTSNAEVYVYTVAGSKVLATTFIQGQTTYDLQFTGLAAGTYFIIVNTKDKLYQSKFIKE